MPSHSNLSLPLLSNPFAPPIHTFIALPLIPPLFTPSLSPLPISICPLIPTPIALPLTPPPFPLPQDEYCRLGWFGVTLGDCHHKT